jgi:hypothetical protein
MKSSVRSHGFDPAKLPAAAGPAWEAGAVRHPAPTTTIAATAAETRSLLGVGEIIRFLALG